MFFVNSRMTLLDWSIVLLYFVFMLTLGISVRKRAGKSLSDFFVSGRKLTWYLAGFSLIATSFASDTPLWVSGLVRRFGIYAVWQYWSPAIGAGVAVFLFSRLWRRLGILTDLELIEIRYGGKGAAILRGTNALWSSLIMNSLIMGWVTKAMENILSETLGLSATHKGVAVGIAIGIALVYCVLAGLWGVVVTDFFQLILATFGTIALAYFSVKAVGSLDILVEKLHALPDWPGIDLTISPRVGSGQGFLSIWNAVAFFGFMWWGLALSGSYNAQRLLATKDEKHSSYASLLYTIIYWGVNAWPWIIVALCSLVLLPGFDGGPAEEKAYPYMMMAYLPQGLRGMLFVAMLAAFMSTISTMINWGSSYFVNDFYRRFINRDRKESSYVMIARLVSILMAVLGGTVAYFADSIQVLIQIGLILMTVSSFLVIIRWFWWRMNAWSEIAGLLTTIVLTLLMLVFKVFNGPARFLFGNYNPDGSLLMFNSDYDYFGLRIFIVLLLTSFVTVITALMTKHTSTGILKEFVTRVRPFKLLWKPFIERYNIKYNDRERIGEVLLGMVMVALCIYSLLFSIGKFLFGSPLSGTLFFLVFIITLFWTLKKIQKQSVVMNNTA